jgi:hypothetical protein
MLTPKGVDNHFVVNPAMKYPVTDSNRWIFTTFEERMYMCHLDPCLDHCLQGQAKMK